MLWYAWNYFDGWPGCFYDCEFARYATFWYVWYAFILWYGLDVLDEKHYLYVSSLKHKLCDLLLLMNRRNTLLPCPTRERGGQEGAEGIWNIIDLNKVLACTSHAFSFCDFMGAGCYTEFAEICHLTHLVRHRGFDWSFVCLIWFKMYHSLQMDLKFILNITCLQWI